MVIHPGAYAPFLLPLWAARAKIFHGRQNIPIIFSPGHSGGHCLRSHCPKNHRGGDFLVKKNAIDAHTRKVFGNGAHAGVHAGRYTQKDLDFLFPLLEIQPYIRKLAVWDNEEVTFDLGDHYKYTTGPLGWRGNQTQCYAMVCGLDIHTHHADLMVNPWLIPVDPIKIPGRPIVINRTNRYLHNSPLVSEQWQKWVAEGLDSVSFFIGSEQECDDFNRLYKCNVPHQPISDMLEMARLIQGAEQFMGNQSVPLSVAIGLGKTFWCETRKDWDNFRTPHGWGDVWFPRVNGHYF